MALHSLAAEGELATISGLCPGWLHTLDEDHPDHRHRDARPLPADSPCLVISMPSRPVRWRQILRGTLASRRQDQQRARRNSVPATICAPSAFCIIGRGRDSQGDPRLNPQQNLHIAAQHVECRSYGDRLCNFGEVICGLLMIAKLRAC